MKFAGTRRWSHASRVPNARGMCLPGRQGRANSPLQATRSDSTLGPALSISDSSRTVFRTFRADDFSRREAGTQTWRSLLSSRLKGDA